LGGLILRCEGEARASKDEVAYYAMIPQTGEGLFTSPALGAGEVGAAKPTRVRVGVEEPQTSSTRAGGLPFMAST